MLTTAIIVWLSINVAFVAWRMIVATGTQLSQADSRPELRVVNR